MTDGADRPLVAVLDYGIGNLRSAQKALERVGADARLTADHGLIGDAAAVVLPGVGAFGACLIVFMLGRLIAHRYLVEGPCERTPSSTSYRAYHLKLDRSVLLRILPERNGTTRDACRC